MRPYEVMVIFEAGVEPPAIQGVVDQVLDVIRGTGGNPGAIDRWGKRTFAYEVNHKREGYYVLIEFTGEPQTVADLERMLSLADQVVRHKVIRLPDKAVARKAAGGSPGGSGRPGRAPAPPEPAPAAGDEPQAAAG